MLVKVWNDNKHPYKEKFRDHDIYIPPGQCVELEKDDAEMFYGTFAGLMTDGDGNADARGYKMLRIEYPKESVDTVNVARVNELLCMSCRYLAVDNSDLQNHLLNHSEERAFDEEAEKVAKTRKHG